MRLKSGSKFIVSPEIRREISQSNGELCSPEIILERYAGRTICSVGDVTTRNLRAASIDIFLQVVDLKTKRTTDGSFFHEEGSIRLFNPPGVITHDLFIAGLQELFLRLIVLFSRGICSTQDAPDISLEPECRFRTELIVLPCFPLDKVLKYY